MEKGLRLAIWFEKASASGDRFFFGHRFSTMIVHISSVKNGRRAILVQRFMLFSRLLVQSSQSGQQLTAVITKTIPLLMRLIPTILLFRSAARGIYTQIKEDLNLPVGKAGISLIDLHDFQRIASTVRSKPPCQTLYSGACPAKWKRTGLICVDYICQPDCSPQRHTHTP
ncbi:MAG: hypothetical protein KF734_13280 [Saprospiraceae bacterium]|nr:hypothetical protein [Saprospiraceae bacterium]